MPIVESVVVQDIKGAAIPGALVVWWDQAGRSDSRTTDGGGFCNFGHLESGGITMSVQAARFDQKNFYKTDDATTLNVKLEPSTLPFFDVQESGFIRTNGIKFVREDGSPWKMAGLTVHTLISNVSRGEDISWVFDYMDLIGANTVLTIGCHLSQWKKDNGVYYDPRRPDHPQILAALFDQVAARKKRVLFQALADCRPPEGQLPISQKQAIWASACNVAKGRWAVLLGKGNESTANDWAQSELPDYRASDLGGVLTSQGSTGGGLEPYHPFLDFSQWETRIDPVHKLMDDAGAGVLEQYSGYANFPPTPCPVIVVETKIYHDTNPDEFGDFRGTDPAEAEMIGKNSGVNAEGLCFGTTQSLIARVNGPIADECTKRAFRGFWKGALPA